jgi:hypothetical protein
MSIKSTSTLTPMGIGVLGILGQEIRFIRKFRWVMSGKFGSIEFPETFIKLREKPENNRFVVTFFEGQKHVCEVLSHQLCLMNQNKISNHWIKKNKSKTFEGEVDLKLYDGCAFLLETYKLNGVVWKSVNFEQLDYTSSYTTIESEWNYASYEWIPNLVSPFV